MQRQLYTQDISSRQTHHNLQASATLNRRYVRRPASYLTTPQNQLKNSAPRVSSLSQFATNHSQSISNQPQPIAEQKMVQKATNSNAVNITFKHKVKEAPAKKPVSISVSQPSMSRPIETPQPKKIMVLDNAPTVEKNIQQVKLEEKDSTPIFDHQARMDRAFSLVSEQEQSILNQTTQPTPIFTDSFKRRQLLNARAKALAKHEKTAIKLTKKASFSSRPTVAPISIPATNMTATSVESAFSRMQRLDHLEKQAAKTTHAAVKPVASIKTKTASSSKTLAKHNKGARVFFAFLCSSAVVAALFFIVQSNMPDISIKVAAMQTGIQAT